MTDRDRAGLAGLRADRSAAMARVAEYEVRVIHAVEDPGWDSFLAETPGGQHVQSGLWARVKAPLGWRVARVVASQGGRVVGGAQLLARPLPFGGAIGHVRRGPVLAVGDPMLAECVIDELLRAAAALRVRLLVLQPPQHGEALARRLPAWGFRPSPMAPWPTATLAIDLTPSVDDILGGMKDTARYNVRLAQRKGITVREGDEHDLRTFHGLLAATGRRQGFHPYSEDHLRAIWQAFRPRDHIRMFLAEHSGEPVSASLVIPFGDTMTHVLFGWSGQHGKHKPNELLYWTTVAWAKSHGYRVCDLGGLHAETAEALLHGRPVPDSRKHTPDGFKLGFGGQVICLPRVFYSVPGPLPRWVSGGLASMVGGSSAWRNAMYRVLDKWRP